MKEKLKVLIELQECDNQIKSIQKKTNEAPLKIRQFMEELEATEQSYKGLKDQITGRERDKKNLEGEIEELGNRIDKSNTKLDQIKSNKEYQAALKEIDELNREKSRKEDEAIEIMEEIENLAKEYSKREKEREESERIFSLKKREIEDELEAFKKTLEKLSEQRAAICSDVEKTLLDKYDFLREKRQGIAMSPVTKSVCQTCHMNIPPQKFNELVRGAELMTCPHCNRIIYWGDNEFFKKVDEGLEEERE